MTFIAKYDGTCAGCGEPISEGDRLEWADGPNGGRAVHEDCTEDLALAKDTTRPTCPKCWQLVAVNGACGCVD